MVAAPSAALTISSPAIALIVTMGAVVSMVAMRVASGAGLPAASETFAVTRYMPSGNGWPGSGATSMLQTPPLTVTVSV